MNKKIKITLGIFVGLVVFTGLAWMARPNSDIADIEPETKIDINLTASEKNYDFGDISMANGIVTHRFKIINSSEVPLQINKMYTSCMCTAATLYMGENKFGPMGMPGHVSVPGFKAELQPGAEAEVEVAFDPTAHGPAGVGRIVRSVYLESNGQTIMEFGIAAFVKP